MKHEEMEVGFKYTYSAKEQEEIRKIREKYQAPEVNGIAELRKLDATVTNKATCASLIIGILGALIMGFGISLILTNLGTLLGFQKVLNIVIGASTGMIGMVLAILAYPVYRYIVKKERAKIAPAILKLTEELMK